MQTITSGILEIQLEYKYVDVLSIQQVRNSINNKRDDFDITFLVYCFVRSIERNINEHYRYYSFHCEFCLEFQYFL